MATLQVAKQELVASLGQLPPESRFSVIFYNLRIRVYVDPSGQHEVMPATTANKTWVESQFEAVVPEGPSAYSLALQTALDLNPDVDFLPGPFKHQDQEPSSRDSLAVGTDSNPMSSNLDKARTRER